MRPLINLLSVKSKLLCYGVNYDSEMRDILFSKAPHIFNKYVHSANFCIENAIVVNIPLDENYTKYSPYTLKYDNDNFYIYEDFTKIEIELITPPDWLFNETADGTPFSNIISLHGRNTLCLSYHKCCDYVSEGVGCKFCSFNNPISKTYELSNIKHVFKSAFERNSTYSVALSNGTIFDENKYVNHFGKIINIIKNINSDCKVSVEISPVSERSLSTLFKYGVSSVFINIELVDDNIRKMICPGKSQISVNEYFKALSFSVEKLGHGMVSSVLIFGLERKEITIDTACKLIDIGVVPVIIPFKPYDHCYLKNFSITNADELLNVYIEIDNYMKKKKFSHPKQHSCNACGGCSGLSDLLKKYEK